MENEKVSAEELAAEQAAVQLPKEEEVRAEVISEFGFDESVDGEKIDKLVAKQMESKKMLSKTIAQKIKHRKEAEELRTKITPPATATPTGNSDLSSKDIIAITKANIHEDDLDEVVDYAKYKKISISEALKAGVIKTMLKDKEEQRKTAQATATTSPRRSSVKTSDEEIVNKMDQGELPEDPATLAQARWNLKKKK